MRKYAVSAPEEVFPVPKQLPVIWTVWVAVAPNAPTPVITGVHADGDDDGDEDDDVFAEGEGLAEGEGAAKGEGDAEREGDTEREGDAEGEGDGEVGDGESEVEASVVCVPVG